MSHWVIHNNSFINCQNGILFNGGRNNTVTANHFERVDTAVYLVSECPSGAIQYSAIVRAFEELRSASSQPAWQREYGLGATNWSRPENSMASFIQMTCAAGDNFFSDNTYCEQGWPNRSDGTGAHSPFPFCKGYTAHECTNTTSVFRGNIKQCRDD